MKEKYAPWNKGRFGGNIQFEIEGREYRIHRFFGKKDKEDTFELYDLETNKLSEDYSSNIGQEIWGVDRESFENSLFISFQNGTENTLLTDIIFLKIK